MFYEQPYYYKEYCYTMDYNFYHNDGETFTPITRKEYKEKTGESNYIIDKLHNSAFPWQTNDYIFKSDIYLNKQYYAPVDWKVYNLDKYLNSCGFESGQTDQGSVIMYGYISLKYNKKLQPFLIEKFGKNMIVKLTHDYTTKLGDRPYIGWYDKKLYGEKIVIMSSTSIIKNKKKSHITLYFQEKMIPWMNEKFNIEMADHSKSHIGGRIISNSHKEIIKKLKK